MKKKIISFSGPHGSGKTTAALSLTSYLKKNNIHSGFVPSSSRNSLYLASKNLSEEMHLEVCYLQMTNEIQASMSYDAIVTDRSVFDFYIYGLIRHPNSIDFLKMLKTICIQHSKLYKNIVFMKKIYVDSKIDVDQKEYSKNMHEFFRIENIPNVVYPPHSENDIASSLAQDIN